MKTTIAVIGLLLTASVSAESLTFSEFQIDKLDGWQHLVEQSSGSARGDLIDIHHPEGVGTLMMQSYSAPSVVSVDVLRNLTNVDESTRLVWEQWGDFSGYQHSYSEHGTYFRQWWLANDRTILFVTYSCDPEFRDAEADAVEEMLRSLTPND